MGLIVHRFHGNQIHIFTPFYLRSSSIINKCHFYKQCYNGLVLLEPMLPNDSWKILGKGMEMLEPDLDDNRNIPLSFKWNFKDCKVYEKNDGI